MAIKFTTARSICRLLKRERPDLKDIDCTTWACYQFKAFLFDLDCSKSESYSIVPKSMVGIGGPTPAPPTPWIPVPDEVYAALETLISAIEENGATAAMFLDLSEALVNTGNQDFALDLTQTVPELIKAENPVSTVRAELLARNFELQAISFREKDLSVRADFAATLAEHFRSFSG
jgi:hypothetical protein